MHQSLDKKRIELLILLISVGSVVFFLGIDEFIRGDMDYHKDISNNKLLKPIPINDTREQYITNSEIYYTGVTFHTNDVFCVNNPLNYTILVAVKNRNTFDKIIAIDMNANTEEGITNTNTIKSAVTQHLSFQNITLNKDPQYNEFNGSSNLTITSEQKLGFLLIPVYANGTQSKSLFILKEQPLIIYPATAKLQAQTDRDIIQQNIESARTSSHVEGLTFVIIGLIFIGFFLEAIIHRLVVEY